MDPTCLFCCELVARAPARASPALSAQDVFSMVRNPRVSSPILPKAQRLQTASAPALTWKNSYCSRNTTNTLSHLRIPHSCAPSAPHPHNPREHERYACQLRRPRASHSRSLVTSGATTQTQDPVAEQPGTHPHLKPSGSHRTAHAGCTAQSAQRTTRSAVQQRTTGRATRPRPAQGRACDDAEVRITGEMERRRCSHRSWSSCPYQSLRPPPLSKRCGPEWEGSREA